MFSAQKPKCSRRFWDIRTISWFFCTHALRVLVDRLTNAVFGGVFARDSGILKAQLCWQGLIEHMCNFSGCIARTRRELYKFGSFSLGRRMLLGRRCVCPDRVNVLPWVPRELGSWAKQSLWFWIICGTWDWLVHTLRQPPQMPGATPLIMTVIRLPFRSRPWWPVAFDSHCLSYPWHDRPCDFCFVRISLEQEALRSFLLAHSPPAKNVTRKITGKRWTSGGGRACSLKVSMFFTPR